MFNQLYKFYKVPVNTASMKKKYNLFLTKEMQQYKTNYQNIINYALTSSWVLGDKKISFKNTKLMLFIQYFV